MGSEYHLCQSALAFRIFAAAACASQYRSRVRFGHPGLPQGFKDLLAIKIPPHEHDAIRKLTPHGAQVFTLAVKVEPLSPVRFQAGFHPVSCNRFIQTALTLDILADQDFQTFPLAQSAHLLLRKQKEPTNDDTLLVYFSLVGSGSQAQAHAIVVDDGLLLTQTTQQRELNQPRASSDWHKLLSALRAANPMLSGFVRSYSFVLIIHTFPLLVKRPRAYSLLWFIRYTVLQARKKKDLI